MKTLNDFGEWVISFWWLLIPLFVGLTTALYCYNQPQSVRLSAKEFKCSMTVPDGIGAKCVEYIEKGVIGK